jgi:hypothetical protein
MSKVYVIQATRHQADVSPAQAYGELIFILAPSDRTSADCRVPCQKIDKALEKFDPSEDYILWSGGDPLSLMMAGYILSDLGIEEFRYLRYERADPKRVSAAPFYVSVTVRPFQ